jgi:hypothetical protein
MPKADQKPLSKPIKNPPQNSQTKKPLQLNQPAQNQGIKK